MARTKARGGRDKYTWEKEFIGEVKTKMDVYDLSMDEVAKVLGMCSDSLSIKLNDPSRFKLREFYRLLDFLHMDRAATAEKLFKGECKNVKKNNSRA